VKDKLIIGLLALNASVAWFNTSAAPVKSFHDYPVQPVPFAAVHFDDAFWAPRIETNRVTTIPYAFAKCEESGRMYNFERAADVLRGEKITDLKPPGYPFDDTDPYKVLEGAAYGLAVQPDPKMDAYLDKLIALIASAQEPDGYLYTTRTIDPQHPHPWAGTKRWVKTPDLSHELYDAGHLFEAACAHYQATGKTNLLNVAIKEADLLCTVFGPGTNQLHLWPGHEIVEMGLAKLYRVTGRQKYLDLAKYFIDVRGSYPGGDDYHQSRIPPVKQTAAVGHAVRAGYLYSGMADVAALTDDTNYIQAIDTIWANCVGKKLYLTGGIGARHAGEAFGGNYELPNLSAYNETCAAVANCYWNQRLFLLHGDAKYVDVLERTLYNGLLSGVSLDGTRFFYPNPLESDGNYERSPWFGCACCPGNITRFMPSIPGYAYAQQGKQIFVNLFASGTADIKLDDGAKIRLAQATRYPWDGAVKITIAPEKKTSFTLAVRIPGWARGEVVPGNLYHYADASTSPRGVVAGGATLNKTAAPQGEPATLKVNGKAVKFETQDGYAHLDRKWKAGDVVELNLPMPIRRVVANDKVTADAGRVALERGPVVYCAEWPDNPDGKVRNLVLPDSEKLTAEFEPTLLNGVEVIRGQALGADGKKQAFTAIPYYAWANRGKGEMTVWLRDTTNALPGDLPPTIASTSRLTLSHPGTNPKAINDQRAPSGFSNGEDVDFFHWWPRKGGSEWVQYDCKTPATVRAVEVYWFDDTGRGECRVPQSWKLLYRENGDWKPVSDAIGYGCAADKFNRTTFPPITTDGLRLDIQLQTNWSAGIYEWRVE
jgi:uncharacterized protein